MPSIGIGYSMSLLSRLFGGSKTAGANPQHETYKNMQIYAEPQREGGTYRLAARIAHDVDGEIREHHLIRADTFQSIEDAKAASMAKAKQMIDEQGIRLFD